MPDDIERIVDRKLIKQRVHYYVVWKGFGQENNTWESRIDLMADGYSDIIKSFESPLTPHVREMTPPAASTEHKKPVTLSYEEEEESVLLKPQSNEKTATSESSATISHDHEHASPAQNGLIAKAVESGYLASFLSVAAVVGSLVVSQMLPRDADETELWRRWLSFLTPVVALLLFFHQKDARASAKWVATGLAWRAAAELLLLISDTPREFEMMVAISVALANVALLIAVVSILRNREHEHSKSTLALLTVGVLTLFLSDSWVISAENSELESRVILMSMAVLTIALSPMPTVSSEDDD
ncbi:Zinc (Zn2)-Iron (Fe2) Permease (ZIP) Family [Phytophthora nicotianae]|uniref:Zinc (Zn2)-Iron (Fe2) Permease (ZIP) Family n=1 Tax=Phytophthora nicotianae TaxID=4792 RepID=A0A0W8D6V6_PHYNI|nr:Zinc (Zn2)-Iron (Fe2) Permease (ZIP) Family [Phytophthora nicotianae]